MSEYKFTIDNVPRSVVDKLWRIYSANRKINDFIFSARNGSIDFTMNTSVDFTDTEIDDLKLEIQKLV